MYDISITGGTIVNGDGKPLVADIAVKNGIIVKMGRLAGKSLESIDAGGMTVSPGFIDFHSHNDRILSRKTPHLAKITQGITTEVMGNCGFCEEKDNKSFAASCPDKKRTLDWKANIDYFGKLPLVTNSVLLVGHNNIRTSVLGMENRPPSRQELSRMESAACEAMEAGYRGLSTGLIYPPGIFADRAEIVSLARVASKYGGIYASHIRGEAETLLEAVGEALLVGREAGISTQISHLKAMGKGNWHKVDRVLGMILSAREGGLNVNYDQYPYTAASTTASILLPPWMLEGGSGETMKRLADRSSRERARLDIANGIVGWQNLLSYGPGTVMISRVKNERNRHLEGVTLPEIARRQGKDPIDALFDLLLEEKCSVLMIIHLMCEDSVKKIIRNKTGFIGTDGICGKKPHPRLWGSFPRVLSKYVREEKVLSLEDAIYKFSRGPAEKLGLSRRGEIKEGNFADIVVFDSGRIRDMATFEDSERRAEGISYVIINGKTAISGGRFRKVTAGKLLRKGED